MSDSTPAASNAALSRGRSLASQRADEAVSGRVTPPLPGQAPGPTPRPGPLAPRVHDDADMLCRATYLRRTPAARDLTTPLGHVFVTEGLRLRSVNVCRPGPA